MSEPLPARNLGLDILRSVAIGLVLVAHALSFFTRWTAFDLNALYYVLGFLGVELFFALSGFLIGRILIETVLSERTWPSLRRFYVRRWLRTLPPYYLVLAVLPLARASLQLEQPRVPPELQPEGSRVLSGVVEPLDRGVVLPPDAARAPVGGALGSPETRGGLLHGLLRDHRALARGALCLRDRVRPDLGLRHPQEASPADGQPDGRRGARRRLDPPAAGMGTPRALAPRALSRRRARSPRDRRLAALVAVPRARGRHVRLRSDDPLSRGVDAGGRTARVPRDERLGQRRACAPQMDARISLRLGHELRGVPAAPPDLRSLRAARGAGRGPGWHVRVRRRGAGR